MDDHKKFLAALFRKSQAGDRRALQQLCSEIEGILRPYFRSRFRNQALVNDLCQESYLRLLNNFNKVDEPLKLKAFVLKIAFHVMQDHFRKKYQRAEEEFVEAPTSREEFGRFRQQVESTDSPDDSPIEKMDLEMSLNSLPGKTRTILALRNDGYKFEEIAENLDLSVSAVKMQYKRGMEKLKILLFNVTFWVLFTTIQL